MAHDDLERVLAWRNHPDVYRYMYTQNQITLDEHRRWFERTMQDSRKHLLIYELDNQPFGFVNFTESSNERVADWGFYTVPNAPKGIGRRLGQAALDHGFNELKFHKICGQVLAFNDRSIRFHKTLGFLQEATLCNQHFDGEHYHDVICFGLLHHHWESSR